MRISAAPGLPRQLGLQKSNRSLPGELGCRRIIRVRSIFLEKPVLCPRICVERDVLPTGCAEDLLTRKGMPIRLSTILELHEAVFRGIKDDAGQWRRVNVRIAGGRHVPPRMERVVPMLDEWIEGYAKKDLLGEDVFSVAAWMHFGFESIHPFSDGNGRVGRLLLNLHFLKHNWPPVHILPSDKDLYLKSLDKGHAGALVDLMDFLRHAMGRSLLDLLDQVGTREDELKPLKKLARNTPYSAKYLALRASQSRLPALKLSGDWHSSERAITVYREFVAR